MPSQPNILLIVLDTQRRDRLSLYGAARQTSPQLDDFAQHSTIFDRAIAPAQWTIPAHASLFTGVYPSSHQLTQAYQQLSGSYATLAEILQLGGYHTVAFCNNPLLGVLDHGLQRGFDAFYNYAGTTPNRPVDLARTGLRRGFDSWFRRFARRMSNRFAHSDTLFRLSLNPLIVPAWSRLVNFKGSTARSTGDLRDYWQRHQAGGAERPIFAFMNLMGTHTPYHPPREWLDRFAPELSEARQAYRFMARHNADAVSWISPLDEPLPDWQQHALETFYDAEIAAQDAYLGSLLHGLRESGALDNTLVMVLADHGEGHGDHQFFGHSFVVYQELVHVPMIIHHPERFPAGKRITRNVSTRRVFHTALDFAGLKVPADERDPNAQVEQLSLARAINGQPDREAGIAFSEAFPPDNLLKILRDRQPAQVARLQLDQVRRGVYHGDHKLAMVGDSVEGLYRPDSDPLELRDIAAEDVQTTATLRETVAHFVQHASGGQAAINQGRSASPEVLDALRALGYID